MRALVEDTKKLSLNNNSNSSSNNNNNIEASSTTKIVTNNLSKNKSSKMQQQSTATAGNSIGVVQKQQRHHRNNNTTANTNTSNINSNSNCSTTTSTTTTAAPTTTNALVKSSNASNATNEELAGGVQDTIYLCNFRVSVDGEWLCLKELQDLDVVQSNSVINSGGNGVGFGYRGQQHRQLQYGGPKSKRWSGLSAYGFEDNGILAIQKLIEPLLSDERDNGRDPYFSTRNAQKHDFGSGEWSKISRDPAEIERSNLVNICKLVVKELLEQSLRFGRMLDSDHLPLQHFFIVMEHVLGHGLRPKKGLLGPRKELWDLLQSVENYCPEAQDITASVRDLPTVRTPIGRARAWLRIALMQKKLSDYLQALIEHRDDILFEYYEPHALMLSDEIVVIMGILVGLNVIDCNLCVKEEDLDSQQGVIDFSLYLRSSSRNNDTEEEVAPDLALNTNDQGNMIAVLDQKNYIEELNRHLNATVGNLQAKVESLTITNALMKEDLAIARNSLSALRAENETVRQHPNNSNCLAITASPNSHGDNLSSHSSSNSDKSKSMDSLIADLTEEKKRSAELERELELHISLKAESDMAMKLLEKDIHEKQDMIVALRRQLDNVKQLNLDMYRKLQECEDSLKHKANLLDKLETQKSEMIETISKLQKTSTNEKLDMEEQQNTSHNVTAKMTSLEERAARADAECLIEREWRMTLLKREENMKEQMNFLQNQNIQLAEEIKRNGNLKSEMEKVRSQWSEAQMTLEELGIQLSMHKLKVVELEDRLRRQQNSRSKDSTHSEPSTGTASVGIWTPDSIASHCTACRKEFNITRRKHHCRSCGDIFCNSCSEHVMSLLNDQGQLGKPVRVCDVCYTTRK